MSESRAPGSNGSTFFKRTGSGTSAPGASAPTAAAPPVAQAAPAAPAQPGPIGFHQPAPVVASADPGAPAPEVVQPAAQPMPATAQAPVTAATAVVPVAHASAPALPADLVQELSTQLAMAGIDPNSPCGLLDMGGVQDSLGSSLPIIRLEHAMGNKAQQHGLQRGLLTNMATMEQVPSMRIVSLAVKMQRIFFPEEYDPSEADPQPLCMSLDGKSAHHGKDCDAQRNGLRPGLPCATCQYTKWREEGGKRKKPLCAETYVMLGYDVEGNVPVVFPFKRTAIKSFRAAHAQMQTKGMKWGLGLPLALRHCSVSFVVKPVGVKNYYVPGFDDWRQVPLDDAAGYASMLSALIGMFAEVDTSKEGADAYAAERAAEAGGADTGFAPENYEGQGGGAAPAAQASNGNGNGGGWGGGQRGRF